MQIVSKLHAQVDNLMLKEERETKEEEWTEVKNRRNDVLLKSRTTETRNICCVALQETEN